MSQSLDVSDPLDAGDGGVTPQLPAGLGRVLHVVDVAAVLSGGEGSWKLCKNIN